MLFLNYLGIGYWPALIGGTADRWFLWCRHLERTMLSRLSQLDPPFMACC